MSQTRLTLHGLRHYVCNGVPRPLPSVTSILSATQTEETRKKLAKWNELNPGVAEKAAERGSWIHNAVENYIRGLRVEPPHNYQPYWDDMPPKLDELLDGGTVLWSEKPYNKPMWNKYVGKMVSGAFTTTTIRWTSATLVVQTSSTKIKTGK